MTAPATPTLETIRRRIALMVRGNLGVMMLNQVLLALTNLVLLILINRVYARPGDTGDAGRLAAIMSIMMAAVLLAVGGVARAVTLRLSCARADPAGNVKDSLSTMVGGGLVLASVIGMGLALVGLAAPSLVLAGARAWWPAHADLVDSYVRPLQLGALWLPGYSVIMMAAAVYDGFQSMRWSLLAEAGTLQLLRILAAVLVMSVLGWAWTSLVSAWAVAFVIAHVVVLGEMALFLRVNRQPVAWRGLPLGGLVRDGAVLFLPTMAPLLISRAGVLIAWAGAGVQASAGFWVTWTLATAATEFCMPVSRVLFPAVPNLRRHPDRGKLTRVLRASFWGVSAVTIASFIVIIAFKHRILTYLNQELQAAALTAFLAAAFFDVHRMVFNPVLLVMGRGKALALLEWLSLASILAGGFAAVNAWGVLGLAGVFVVVQVLSAVVRVSMIARVSGAVVWLDTVVSGALVLAATGALLFLELKGRG